MASNRAVNVVIKGDYDNSDIQRAIRDLQKLGGTTEEQGSKLGTLGKAAALAAAAGIAIAAKETYDFAKASIDAAQEAQVADDRFNQIARSMGFVGKGYADATARASEYASTLSAQIGVEDESIKAVQAKLLTFKSVGKTVDEAGGAFDRATQAAYDLAAAGFGSAETNATQLGKALQDPVKGLTALGRAGVTFTAQEKEKIKALVESGKAAEAQEIVLKAIEKQVGGTAEATATATQKMKVAFGELQEAVGGALLPVVQNIATELVPIFNDLQAPLKEVAAQVGGALGDAFKELAPILPVLGEALGKVAGVLGNVLVSAIRTLIPIVTPLLNLFGDLATRIGPILAPLLEKLGGVLGKILSAVSPLLAPLTDLVFAILEAAMPILDIVVELFSVLVDALAPLIGVVATLLAPLGQLINVLLRAIEPILRPLLPLIEALAAVLGDVLTRAMGLIISAVGGLIFAFSKLAPFILENVTIPVVRYFLDMAERLVGAAEVAFGWVPGLGDKLATAKDAIAKFRDDSTKAIGDAAKTISTEGAKIGGGLIDQGVALMTDPSTASRVRKAGEGVGYSMAEGMRLGIQNGQIPVAAAAAATIDGAERAARRAAESHSPSKKFQRIGNDLIDGLNLGIEEKTPVVVTVIDGMMAKVIDAAKKAKFSDEALGDMGALRDRITSQLTDVVTGLAKGLEDAQKKVDDWKTNFASSLASAFDISGIFKDSLDKDGKLVVSKWTAGVDAAFAQFEWYTNVLKAIKAQGGSDALIAYLQQQGIAQGGAQGQAMLDNGLIPYFSQKLDAVKEIATQTADAMVPPFLVAGVEQAQATYDGMKAALFKGGPVYKAIMTMMDNLAEAMKRTSSIDVFITRHVTTIENAVKAASTPKVPEGATGGIVNVPTVALIGEAGPEAVVPLDRTPGNGPLGDLGSGGNTYNITVQAGVGDPRQIGQQVVEYIKRFEAASGPVFAAA